MKAIIYTECISQEEWFLGQEDIDELIKYLKSDKAWNNHFKEKINIDILKELELNPDKYADQLRCWLYSYLEHPHKEWIGEQGNITKFSSEI